MDNQSEETFSFPIVMIRGVFLIWFVLFAIEFRKSYLEALTDYEIAYKLNWSKPTEWVEPALSMSFKYQKGKQFKPKGPNIIIMNRQTHVVIADYQKSDYQLSNPDIKDFVKASYDIDYATFYTSSDYSVMLKHNNLYWMTKATVHVDESQTTRIYLKKSDPKFKNYNRTKNTKNFYIFILITLYSLIMLILFSFLIKQMKVIQKDTMRIFFFIGIIGLVTYLIFYKFIFLWMQVEFRIFLP